MTLDPLDVAAIALGAVLIGVGILLVIAAFIIQAVQATKPPAKVEQGFWDFMTTLANKLNLLAVPGFLMIGLGIFLVGIVVVGVGPFGAETGTAAPTPTPTNASPGPAAS